MWELITLKLNSSTLNVTYLVGGLEHFLFFHSVGNFIIPIDYSFFFFSEGLKPPTR